MRYLFIIPLVFSFACCYSQGLNKPSTRDYTGLYASQFSKPSTEKSHIALPKPYWDAALFSKSNAGTKSSQYLSYNTDDGKMRRTVRSSETIPSFPGSESNWDMVNVYSTQGRIGNIKISCDYLFDDEGRLVEAEPMWYFGK